MKGVNQRQTTQSSVSPSCFQPNGTRSVCHHTRLVVYTRTAKLQSVHGRAAVISFYCPSQIYALKTWILLCRKRGEGYTGELNYIILYNLYYQVSLVTQSHQLIMINISQATALRKCQAQKQILRNWKTNSNCSRYLKCRSVTYSWKWTHLAFGYFN